LLMYQLCENPILDCIFIATAKWLIRYWNMSTTHAEWDFQSV
jgi:hypothetical protein